MAILSERSFNKTGKLFLRCAWSSMSLFSTAALSSESSSSSAPSMRSAMSSPRGSIFLSTGSFLPAQETPRSSWSFLSAEEGQDNERDAMNIAQLQAENVELKQQNVIADVELVIAQLRAENVELKQQNDGLNEKLHESRRLRDSLALTVQEIRLARESEQNELFELKRQNDGLNEKVHEIRGLMAAEQIQLFELKQQNQDLNSKLAAKDHYWMTKSHEMNEFHANRVRQAEAESQRLRTRKDELKAWGYECKSAYNDLYDRYCKVTQTGLQLSANRAREVEILQGTIENPQRMENKMENLREDLRDSHI